MTRTLTAAAVTVLLGAALTGIHAEGARAAQPLAPLIGPGGQSIGATATSSTSASSDAGVVQSSYIVVLKDAATLLRAGSRPGTPAQRASAAVTRGKRLGASVGHTFSGVFQGYSATLTANELEQVRHDPAVKYVQENMTYRIAGTTQKQLETWGLDRIDQRSSPLNGAYYYNTTGSGVTAYVVDSGIEADHPDLARVGNGVDYVGSSSTGGVDCNGHGTHVAGTIGGGYFGVAKRVTLVPVRVLNCAGTGEQDDILAGLDWVRLNHTGPSVVNLSIETLDPDFDVTLNASVQSLIDSGVSVVAAAGNTDPRGINACNVSPASAPQAITVGASTRSDRAAAFSNYGPCVDLYAPGEGITSDWPKDSKGTYRIATLDGTSMAAPHVTGTVALYLQSHPTAPPAQVSAFIAATASADKITGVNPRYPHDLLFAPQPVTLPDGVARGDRLTPGQNLLRPDRLYSADNAYFLTHRSSDGRLSLYRASSGTIIWSSGHSAAWTNMNASGSLNSYDAYGRRAWSTNTPGGASTMIVNSKGYLVIKRDSDGTVSWTSPH